MTTNTRVDTELLELANRVLVDAGYEVEAIQDEQSSVDPHRSISVLGRVASLD